MSRRNRVALVAATALACAGLGTGAPASADSPRAAETPATVTVIASGLEGPRQLTATNGYFYVAESDAGQVTRVRRSDGTKRVAVANIPLAQGVAKVGSKLYATAGEPLPDGTATPVPADSTKVYVAKPFAKRKTFADPYAFELKYNPDNQTQFDEKGARLDAVSNPYYLIERKGAGFLLMAAAGGNDVLAVSKKGALSPFFVPPPVTTGVCAKADQNSDAGPSCDPVPTGIAYGPDGNIYISGLSGLTPDEARVYVVNKNGKLLKTLTGFSNAAGVAVGPDGSVYISDLLQGLPLGPAAANKGVASTARAAGKAAAAAALDPATVGQIVKIAPDGKKTYAQVTMPGGLLFTDGKLYASTWAAAGEFFQIKHAGQIVSVDPSSFKAQ